jgi:MFS family permease
MLLAGRLLLGLAFTVNGVSGPSLVAESTPGKTHIFLTNAIVIGMPIFGTIATAIIYGIYESTSNWAWRGAILAELFAPTLSMLCLPFVPESPRWLVSRGRKDEAFDILVKMHASTPESAGVVKEEFEQIVQTIEFEKHAEESGANSWKALLATPSDRKRFLIALLLNIFFQVSGSNTFPYFFVLVLHGAGIVDTRDNLNINMGLCIWGVASVALGIWMCGRIGAKTSLLGATSIMTVCLALLAVLTGLNSSTGESRFGIGAVIVIFIFQLASFSTYMILTYTYPPMILRFTQRARGFALAQAIGYGFCVMMSYTLPLALENIGWRFYAINAAWNCGIVAIIWFLFVETKGKTLEEVDALFDGNVHFEVGSAEKGVVVIEGVEASGKSGETIVESTVNSEKDEKKL